MAFKKLIRSITAKLLSFQRSESKFVWILVAVFSLIIFNPLIPIEELETYAFNLLLSFIVLAGILAASDERQIIRQLAVMGVILITLDWVRSLAKQQIPGMEIVVYLLYIIFVITVTIAIIIGVIKSENVTGNVICGGASQSCKTQSENR